LRYGKFITGSAMTFFVLTQGDNAVVGKLLGSVALGYYALAYNLALSPHAAVAEVLSRVMLPAFARIQREPARLRAAYLETRTLTAAAVFPLAAILAAAAPDVVRILLGAKWSAVVPFVQVLSVYGVVNALDAGQKTVLRAAGKPDRALYVDLVRVPLFAVLIYLSTLRFGLLGACWAVVVPIVVAQVVAVPLTARSLGLRVIDLVRVIGRPALATLILLGAVAVVRVGLGGAGPVLRLSVALVAGGAVYLGSLAALAPDLVGQVVRRVGVAVPALLPAPRG
jgi:PST family polysaccharide transporter/lipopolysaccharide exporter